MMYNTFIFFCNEDSLVVGNETAGFDLVDDFHFLSEQNLGAFRR